MVPRCPLCGATTTWYEPPGMPHSKRSTIPDECQVCKEEDRVHWKQWDEGIDVTQFGGGPIRNPYI